MEQCCAEPPAVPTRDPADAWDAALDPARHSMSNSHVGVDDDEFTGALLEAHKHLLLVLLRDLGGRQALEVEVDKLVGTPLRVRVLVAPHDHVLHECRPRGVVHLRGHISQHLPQQRRQLLLVELSAAILIVRCKEVARALLLLERSHLLDRLLREFGANLLASEKLVVELSKAREQRVAGAVCLRAHAHIGKRRVQRPVRRQRFPGRTVAAPFQTRAK
mmetsp:Transcript_6929/g.18199  ORF Transcript_6929/g.18199 Transcript_6929/m.18199 type:complete len:219 (+) Transcript_6929:116-772(+)